MFCVCFTNYDTADLVPWMTAILSWHSDGAYHISSTQWEAWELGLGFVASEPLGSGISSQDHVLLYVTVCI